MLDGYMCFEKKYAETKYSTLGTGSVSDGVRRRCLGTDVRTVRSQTLSLSKEKRPRRREEGNSERSAQRQRQAGCCDHASSPCLRAEGGRRRGAVGRTGLTLRKLEPLGTAETRLHLHWDRSCQLPWSGSLGRCHWTLQGEGWWLKQGGGAGPRMCFGTCLRSSRHGFLMGVVSERTGRPR